MGLISRVSSRTYRFLKPFPKMVQRITYRRRLAWNTRSNRRRVSKTPGGKLVFLYTGKRGTVTKCGDTGKDLQPGRTTRRSKTVSRAYGGVVSAAALKRRITRAFLIEEQKIVRKVVKAQKDAVIKASKDTTETKSKKKSKK